MQRSITRTISSSGTMVVDLIKGHRVEWTPAVPCWQHPAYYNPTSTDISQGMVWIWSSYWVTQEESHKGAIRIFRKTLDLRQVGEIFSAELSVAVDNKAVVIINGDVVTDVEGHTSLTTFNVTENLVKEAINELEFIVINRGGKTHVGSFSFPESNPAGLIFKLVIQTEE